MTTFPDPRQRPEGVWPMRLTRSDYEHESYVRVTGEVDLSSAATLLAVLTAEGSRRINLDMAGMTFIDSAGLSTLISAHNAGADIVLRNPPVQMQKLLALTGLDELFPVVD